MSSRVLNERFFIRKAVPPTRIGLDGLPVWEQGAEKESSQEV